MEVEKLLDFLHLMEKMKCNTRHCDTSTGRRESVAEHSWRLCMMAFLVRDAFLDLDMDRVLKMCLIHDIGEAVTGDIPAFDKNSVHESVESQAIDWLLSLLSGSVRQDMGALFYEMEEQATDEAKLYKILDRLEALIQHDEADLSTWLPLEYELQFTYGKEECQTFPYTARLREAVDEMTHRKIEEGKTAQERAEKMP